MKRILTKFSANDLIGGAGLLLLAAGLWMYAPALALSVVGALLVGIAVLGELRR